MSTLVEDYAKAYAEAYVKDNLKDVAKNLIKLGLSDEDISTATYLTIEEIKNLRD